MNTDSYNERNWSVDVNVGGYIFTTKRDTLLKSNYFRAILPCVQPTEPIFVDKNPLVFPYILDALRSFTNIHLIPEQYVTYIDFFGIPTDKNTHMILDFSIRNLFYTEQVSSQLYIHQEETLKKLSDKINNIEVNVQEIQKNLDSMYIV